MIAGKAFMNRGVYDSRVRPELPRIALKDEFGRQLRMRQRELADYQPKGHPIHWFDGDAEFSRPRVLLVGDAAGVDPLLGEGIPCALAYGEAAALAIVQAFETMSFGFDGYRGQILAHPLLQQLRRRASAARFLLIPTHLRFYRILDKWWK